MALTVTRCSTTLNRYPILNDISFSLDNEILSIIGPSGSGKTTLLRCIAGLQPYQGEIILNGINLNTLSVQQRNIGMVEQFSTLFPHLSVFENIAYPLKVRHRPKQQIIQRVQELLEQFHIQSLSQRLPQEISGGEQQRVAIARAFIYEPNLLLLDEPFGSLDALWRYDLLHWLKTVLQARPVPTLFVTHDQREAKFISERVVCLIEGKIATVGTWSEIIKCNDECVQQLLAKAL